MAEKKKSSSVKKAITLIGEFLFKIMEKICNRLTAREPEKKKKAQFCVNMWAGIVVLLLMHTAASTPWGEGVLNDAFDEFIQKDAKKAVKTIANTGDIFLVDLDHNKPEKPGEEISYISPRDTIAKIIKMAAPGKAEIIVLDILLEKKDYRSPEKDEELHKALEELSMDKECQTKVIFAQRVGKNGKLKRNLFDPLIEKNPNFYRAIPYLYATKKDRVTRYWKAYDVYGKTNIIWSIPVLTLVLNEGRMEDLKKREKQLVQKKNEVEDLVVNLAKSKNKKFVLPFSNKDLFRQRIRFSLIPKDCIDGFPAGNLILPTIKDIEKVDPRRFKDKIVLIGASDPEKGDIHPTPVGDMPGMYIHGNAIHTLLKGLQPKPAPWWIAIVLDIVIIIAVPYFFLRLKSWLAKLIGTIILSTTLALFSYYILFRYLGMFFSFAFGTAAMGYFDTFSGIRETILERKEKKNENNESPHHTNTRNTRKEPER